MEYKDHDKWQTYSVEAADSKDQMDNLKAALDWAHLMERQMDLKMSFGDLAKATLQQITSLHPEINIKDYAFMVKVLGECWKHGDDLLNWHNEKHAGSPSTAFVAIPTHF